jgi:proteic killer suppression protein
VIRSFADADTEAVYNRRRSRRLPEDIQRVALRKLRFIGQTRELRDLANPGNRLEKLRGDREGQYGIRINQQWRICFIWRDGDAFEVEIVDYH